MSNWYVSALLISAAAVLFAWTLHHWRLADHGGLSDADYRFLNARYRRRSRSSLLLGMIGVVLLTEPKLPSDTLALCYWSGVGLLALGALLFAAQDWLANLGHYSRLESAQASEHVRLQAEIERHRRELAKESENGPDDETL